MHAIDWSHPWYLTAVNPDSDKAEGLAYAVEYVLDQYAYLQNMLTEKNAYLRANKMNLWTAAWNNYWARIDAGDFNYTVIVPRSFMGKTYWWPRKRPLTAADVADAQRLLGVSLNKAAIAPVFGQ